MMMLIVAVVVVGGAWFYLHGMGIEEVVPGTAEFEQMGIGETDPTMDMKPLDGVETSDVPAAAVTKDAPAPSAPAVAGEKVVNVTAANFAFSVKEIRVKKGDKVTVNFESTGGLHDWVVDEFDGARTKQVRPGTKTSATFTVDEAGTFEFYCSVGDHRALGMVGNLVVE